MVATAAVRMGMSLTDYLARSGERFELINGEEVPMSPTLLGHDILKITLFSVLRDYARLHQLGDVFIETIFTLAEASDVSWVKGSLVPDVSFTVTPRFAEYKVAYPDWRTLPMTLVPDLAIEIQSPSERNSKVLTKVAYMLEVGVKVIWVINQSHQSVTIYSPEADPHTLTADDTLTSELLPGWSMVVRDLFADDFKA